MSVEVLSIYFRRDINMKKLAILIPLLLLQGCDDNGVNQVKNYIYDFDKSMSVENALDHRSVCKSTNWKSFKDQRNRDVVEYRCDLIGANDYSEDIKNKTLVTLEEELTKAKKTEQQVKKNNEDIVNSLKVAPDVKTYMDSMADLYYARIYDENTSGRGAGHSSLLNNSGELDDVIMSGVHELSINNSDGSIVTISTDKVKDALSNISNFLISKGIDNSIKEKNAFSLVFRDNSDWNNTNIERYSDNKTNGVNAANDNVNAIENKIQQITDIQNVKTVEQRFQWSVIKGQDPVLLDSIFDAEFENGKHQEYHFNDQINYYSIIKDAYQNSASTYAELESSNAAPRWPFGQ